MGLRGSIYCPPMSSARFPGLSLQFQWYLLENSQQLYLPLIQLLYQVQNFCESCGDTSPLVGFSLTNLLCKNNYCIYEYFDTNDCKKTSPLWQHFFDIDIGPLEEHAYTLWTHQQNLQYLATFVLDMGRHRGST